MKKNTRPIEMSNRLMQYLVWAYQAVVVLVIVAAPFWAVRFFRQPFLGVFVEHTLVTNGIGPATPSPAWELYYQIKALEPGSTGFGYQLIGLAAPDGSNAITPRNYRDIEAFLSAYRPGDQIQATFRNENEGPRKGETVTFQVTLSLFPFSDQIRFFLVPYFTGLVYLAVSLWIFGLRRTETSARAFSVMASSVAVITGSLLNIYTTHVLTFPWLIAVSLAGASMFHMGLVFPQEARIEMRYPFLRLTGYLVGLGLSIFQFTALYDFTRPTYYAQTWKFSYIFTGLGILFFLAATFYRWRKSPSPVVRQQARTILFGALLSFAYITLWLLLSSFYVMNFDPYLGFLPLVVFPLVTGYTILRYRLLRADYLLTRTILYSLLSLLAMLSYVLIAIGIGTLSAWMLNVTIAPDNPLLIASAVFVFTLLLNPVRTRLQEQIDSIFFRGEAVHQKRLNDFSRELTHAVGMNDILRSLREQVTVSLLPGQFHIFLYNPLTDQYTATPDETGQLTSDIQFDTNSPLPRVMRREMMPVFVDETHIPETLLSERGRVALLDAQLFIPLPGRDRLIGWLALGERLSGESYAAHDIAFLEALGRQAAVALERAQVLANMERRVSEMNALARVAQGINITLRFDDILELIYAQAIQITPGSDARLTLYNRTGQYYYHAFYVENDERITSMENIPLQPKTSLEQEVIASRRAILTQDFLTQCQVMGVMPPVKGLYAWMGVPLNAGAETIGAFSIASRNPAISYSVAQMSLLQAIADQAAGAIVKSRLLQETERRAEQLATLNMIARQLTSTTQIETLSQTILQSAVKILNAEAGTLFIVDEQTGELVFKVTEGPVAQNLVGQRLPPGSGFVGQAVLTRQPVIINNVASSATWNASTDRQTGFVTRSLLAIPMEVKDRVIGVIEVINKKDGSPFTEDDQNLLSAFSGQASVAFENARLFTLTDQELNARVEELSVMQRIDRELNTSLEVGRTMQITLDWALRQSSADAAFVGFVEEEGVRLIAEQGYADELKAFRENYMSIEHPALQEPIQTGQMKSNVLEQPDPNRIFLKNGLSQIVIPIRRESKTIAILLLESLRPDSFSQETFNFISRLADHAAIAISNAQLYSKVQQANVAKSEFVSFVAHELKNPMTAIKGYAELLAAGAGGTISETQAAFLSVIRSNIERMKTIVEDLNDASKLEAGRLRLDLKPVEVPQVVEQVIRSTKRQIEDKNQTIEVELPSDLPKIWADRTRIEQILVNLVSNAHKYTPEGGQIVVRAERAANQWDPQGAAEVVHISVQDNGLGMTPEDQRKIFQKFFRSDDEQARKSPGTGLGLNITKSLVEMQGGKIWFESEFRKGTTFHFTIPISEN
ncbi:MAG: GAF domain-containing protein [Anaerolineales bacterium]|nr:GAF domain-containing protein [Anaerolineales bacterium]